MSTNPEVVGVDIPESIVDVKFMIDSCVPYLELNKWHFCYNFVIFTHHDLKCLFLFYFIFFSLNIWHTLTSCSLRWTKMKPSALKRWQNGYYYIIICRRSFLEYCHHFFSRTIACVLICYIWYKPNSILKELILEQHRDFDWMHWRKQRRRSTKVSFHSNWQKNLGLRVSRIHSHCRLSSSVSASKMTGIVEEKRNKRTWE